MWMAWRTYVLDLSLKPLICLSAVGSDATQGDLLAFSFTAIEEELTSKSSIVGILLSDLDSMSGSISLKRAFGSHLWSILGDRHRIVS
jgi:hypothetical protein